MTSSLFQQAVSSQASEHWEPPHVHYGFTLYNCPSSYQYQEVSFNQTLDVHAPFSRFPFSPPHNIQPWNTQVDGLSMLDRESPSFSNNHQASLTSSITQPPFHTTSIGEAGHWGDSKADWFALEAENAGQWSTSVDGSLRWETSGASSGAQAGSERVRASSDPSDEPQSKRIRRDPNVPPVVLAPSPSTETGVTPHPHPFTSAGPSCPLPTEEVEPIAKFTKGNVCRHNGCPMWHKDLSTVSRHRRAHVDKYICPNPECYISTASWRALREHWKSRGGVCLPYKQEKGRECLVKGRVNLAPFDPQIHQPYKRHRMRRRMHLD